MNSPTLFSRVEARLAGEGLEDRGGRWTTDFECARASLCFWRWESLSSSPIEITLVSEDSSLLMMS